METVTTYNGNGKQNTRVLPIIHILIDRKINDVALAHITKNTDLVFVPSCGGYSAQPVKCEQLAALLMTYNFKTQYHDNANSPNTLYLKFCNDEGFKVRSVCYACCKHNNIHTHDLTEDDRLAC